MCDLTATRGQGWTVIEIPSTRTVFHLPSPQASGTTRRWPPGRDWGPDVRRHGLERELTTCHGRVPGSVHRAGAQAGAARRRRRDLYRELPEQCRPRAPRSDVPALPLHRPADCRALVIVAGSIGNFSSYSVFAGDFDYATCAPLICRRNRPRLCERRCSPPPRRRRLSRRSATDVMWGHGAPTACPTSALVLPWTKSAAPANCDGRTEWASSTAWCGRGTLSCYLAVAVYFIPFPYLLNCKCVSAKIVKLNIGGKQSLEHLWILNIQMLTSFPCISD